MQPVKIDVAAPARRVVLFSADGLRADRFYELNETGHARAPFLHGIAATQGRWGVSHTHVPTESRPGHVAMLAGLYEDVSAVTKGWQHNPVSFDSVLNESTRAWAYGSPDIIPMFVEHSPHVEWESYSSELEDFAGDSSVLDTWVFDKVESLIERAEKNASLNADLRRDGVVIFLHLLALDTAGHAFRPSSPEYLQNILKVDDGVRKISEKLSKFYGDEKTAFVFTSDHGMSRKGAHGDGDPANTQTPLVVWGSGVPPPLKELRRVSLSQSGDLVHDELTAGGDVVVNPESPTPHSWGDLAKLRRFDIQQGDIAPLLATLSGVSIPVNSVGVVPTDYLKTDLSDSVKILFANAKQLLSMLCIKARHRKDTALWFVPFSEVSDCGEVRLEVISRLIEMGQFPLAEKEIREMIQVSQRGFSYYETYDRAFLLAVCSLGYLGWMANCVLFIFLRFGSQHIYVRNDTSVQRYLIAFKYSATVIVFSALIIQHAPHMHYLYCGLTTVLWWSVLSHPLFCPLFSTMSKRSELHTMLQIAAFALSMQILVLAFKFREAFAPAFLLIGLWPFFHKGQGENPFAERLWWLVSSVTVGMFTLLPVNHGDLTFLVVAAGIAVASIIPLIGSALPRQLATPSTEKLTKIQVALILISCFLVFEVSQKLQAREKLSLYIQIMNWVVSVTALFLPYFSSQDPMQRLVSVILAIGPFNILLSVGYETVFYFSLSTLLLCWPIVERNMFPGHNFVSGQTVQIVDCRLAVTFIALIFISFFGTGNVASISSFETSSTYRFVTVFSPFLMGALLILKVSLPFVLIGVALRVVVSVLNRPFFAIVFLVSAFADILCINFLFLVQNEGSWLDIGMSISHHVIINLFIVVILIVFAVSGIYTQGIVTGSKITMD